jgi:hypothetical protein
MRNILLIMATLFVLASQTTWSAVCALNSAGNLAFLAWCIPAENPHCDDDMPVTWPQVNNQAILSNKPATVRVSSSAGELNWSPIETFELKNGQAIELYTQEDQLMFRVIDADWCVEEKNKFVGKKKRGSRCTLY